jgi:hypothetical protein
VKLQHIPILELIFQSIIASRLRLLACIIFYDVYVKLCILYRLATAKKEPTDFAFKKFRSTAKKEPTDFGS